MLSACSLILKIAKYYCVRLKIYKNKNSLKYFPNIHFITDELLMLYAPPVGLKLTLLHFEFVKNNIGFFAISYQSPENFKTIIIIKLIK